jgi:LysM repeat protein
MRARRWALFIGLNVIISVATTLAVLSLKGELERVVVVTVTPSATSPGPVPTAVPAGQAAATATIPTSSPAIEYTVQAGDTLGAIALVYSVTLEDLLLANEMGEGDIIRPDQVLIIPQGEVATPVPITPSSIPATPTPTTETPTAFPTHTPTPPGPVQVRIEEVLAPGQLNREGIVIVNRGRTVNLQGWTLGAVGGDELFIFPRLTLAQEVPVTVYTVEGQNRPQSLHWGLDEAQWGESDTIVELRDAEGDLIATYPVP